MSSLDGFFRAAIKPRHLRLLVAIDDFRNLAKVAANTHVTQPAVSKTLGELERGLGVKLFERTPRGVHPTVYGECLIRHARAVLTGLTQARDELRSLASGAAMRLSVGVLPGAVPALLPNSLALFKRRAPASNVLLREGTMDALLPELWLGRLDLIVGRLQHGTPRPELGEKILSEEPIVLVARAGHPLAARRRLAWGDLAAFPWVLPPVGTFLREPLERAFERHGVALPADSIETLSVHLSSGYLQVSDALAVMALDSALHFERAGQLAMLPLEMPRLLRPLGVTWNRQRALSPGAELLVECLTEAASGGVRDGRVRPQAAG